MTRIEPIEGSGFTAVELVELNSLNKVRVWIAGIPEDLPNRTED